MKWSKAALGGGRFTIVHHVTLFVEGGGAGQRGEKFDLTCRSPRDLICSRCQLARETSVVRQHREQYHTGKIQMSCTYRMTNVTVYAESQIRDNRPKWLSRKVLSR